MVSKSLSVFAAVLVLHPAVHSRGGEPPRVVLLGGSASGAGESPPGLAPADWVQVFLEPAFQGNVEIVRAGNGDGTVNQGRQAIEKFLASKPAAIVLGFGLDDALKSTPADFRREYDLLLDEIARAAPESRVLLLTATPVDERHRQAREERFRSAGGLGEHLRKGFVEPVKEIAAARKLPVADLSGLFEEAVRSGEKLEDLIQAETGQPTARGNLLAGRSIALSVLSSLGRRDRPPSFKEVLGGEGETPILPPPPADLSPVLAVWEKDLEPLWLSRFASEDPDIRWAALKKLFEIGSIPPNFLTVLLSFLEPPRSGLEQEVGNILVSVVQTRKVTKDEAMKALLGQIRSAGPASYLASRCFPLLDQIASLETKGPTQLPAQRNPTPAPPGGAGPAPAVEVSFADEDLALFEGVLSSREQGLRASASHLLSLSGEAGIRRLLTAVKKLPENLSVELLGRLWQWRRADDSLVKDTVIESARGDSREGIRSLSQGLALSLKAREIPLDFLKELFTGETGALQVRAAQLLAERGDDGLEVLVQGLKAPEEDRVQLSRTGLLYIALYWNSDDAARKALAALDEHFTPARQKEFLICLDAVIQKSSPPLACLPEPAGRRILIGRSRQSVPVRASRPPPIPGRAPPGGEVQIGPWPSESNICHVERLKEFTNRLERSLREGSDEEKEAAESLLSVIWSIVGEIQAAALRKTPEAPTPLAQRLEKEAKESLKQGDAKAYLIKAQQAITAGASVSAINSFARKLAATAREDLRDPALAERWAREAISRGGRKPSSLDTLAVALSAQGKFKEAVDLEVEAIQGLSADESQAPYVARALLYLSGKPYVEPAEKK